MTFGSRAKGSRAEIQVARMCEEWWGKVEPGCKFRRTPLSGGWGGRSDADVRAHFKASGDLMTTARSWPFCVEVKHREGWSLEQFLFESGRPSPVWRWWDQCLKAARTDGGKPLMFFRTNRTPWLGMAFAGASVLGGYELPMFGLARTAPRVFRFEDFVRDKDPSDVVGLFGHGPRGRRLVGP